MASAAEQLKQFLENLPERELKKLAATVELDRGQNRYGIPHDAILTLLRPRLAEVRAPRIFTPQRMLCVPFEDMLVFDDPDPKIAGKLARPSIGILWNLVTQELLHDEWNKTAEAFSKAQRNGDEETRRLEASAMWKMAGKAVKAHIDAFGTDPGELRQLAKKMGGTRRLEDVREMANVLLIADDIEGCKTALPRKPILNFESGHVTSIKRYYNRIVDENPGHEIYFLLAIIGRLLQPFPILKVIRALSRKLDDTLTSKSDLGIAGDIVISALEDDAGAVAKVSQNKDADEMDVVEKARRFAAAFKGITSDIGIRRDGDWGKRMYAARGEVSNAVESLILSEAEEKVSRVIPRRGRALAPNFSNFPDEEKYEISERRARALGETMRIADQIGLQSACQSTINTLRKELEGYAAKIIEQLPKVDEENKPEATAHLYAAVRLVELITNSEEADLLRRRGNAALSKQMTS